MTTPKNEAQDIDILSERATGRCDDAGISYYMLSRAIDTNRLRDIPALIAKILERGAWKKWRWIGSDFTATSIDEYVAAHPPRGLGATVDLIDRLLADHPEAQAAFRRERVSEERERLDAADRESQRPTGVHKPDDDVNTTGRPWGNSAAAALRRLRRDRPDIHARVLAGELSPNAGMIEAGFRKKRPSAPRPKLCPNCGFDLTK